MEFEFESHYCYCCYYENSSLLEGKKENEGRKGKKKKIGKEKKEDRKEKRRNDVNVRIISCIRIMIMKERICE